MMVVSPRTIKAFLCFSLLMVQASWEAPHHTYGMHPVSPGVSKSSEDSGKLLAVEPNCNLSIARGFIKEEKFADAIALLTPAIEEGCKSAPFFILRGRAYFGLQKGEEALIDLNRAIKIQPTDPYSYFLRASIYTHLEKLEDAIVDLSKGIGITPNPFLGFMYAKRGLQYLALDQLQKALKDFTQAINQGVSVHYERGYTLDLLGQYEEAVSDFSIALKQEPELNRTLLSRGLAYGCLEQFSHALQDFDKVLAIKPNDVHALLARGWLYLKKDDFAMGIRDLEQASVQNSEDPMVYLNLGTGYYLIENFEKAVQVNARAMEMVDQTSKTFVYLQKGLFLLVSGHRGEANEAYEIGRGLSEANNDRGALESALEDLREAIEKYPTLAEPSAPIIQSLQQSLEEIPQGKSRENPSVCKSFN